jgi:hypothetical protein
MVVGTAHLGTKETLPAVGERRPLVESCDCWDLGRVVSWAVTDVDDNDDTTLLRVALGPDHRVSVPLADMEIRQVKFACLSEAVRALTFASLPWALKDAD